MAEARIIPAPRRGWGLALAAAAAVLLLGLFVPQGVARGWLAGWLACLSVTMGAAVWLLVAALTGGAWAAAAGPALHRLARATPLVALGGAGFLLAAPVVLPWWAGGEEAGPWLSPGFFALRTVAVLALWSGLAWIAGRTPGTVGAALALIAYGLSVSVAGVDWILSPDPGFSYTIIGAQLAVMQMTMAMAAVAVLGPARTSGTDLGGLLLAGVLGSFYLGAMGYVVSWSGNLPEKAAWYLARQAGAGTAVQLVSLLAGVLVPFAVLLVTRWRRSAAVLRVIGACVLVGGLAQFVWLAAPGWMAWAGPVALGGAVLCAAAFAMAQEGYPR